MRSYVTKVIAIVALCTGCTQLIVDDADRHVYRAIDQRQRDALGATSNTHIGDEDGVVTGRERMYRFTPRPLDTELPASFGRANPDRASVDQSPPDAADAVKPAESRRTDESNAGRDAGAKSQEVATVPAPFLEKEGPGEVLVRSNDPPQSPLGKGGGKSANLSRNGTSASPSVVSELDAGASNPNDGAFDSVAGDFEPDEGNSETDVLTEEVFSQLERRALLVFDLGDAINFALRHGRALQDAKEDLYLAALDLTLERHLWTPQFSMNARGEFADFGQVRDFDRAMSTLADVAVTQRLPLGGEVTARLINSFMRDLGEHITSGETGTAILDANIPLLRGAGRVAFESRFQAERSLIYAVRTFERFRRSFVVQVANDYFSLQERKAAISNAFKSYESRRQNWEKADFVNRMGRSRDIFDATRARSSLRSSEANLVSAKEQYLSAVDQFKIVIGMEVDQPLDVVSQDEDQDALAVESLLPEVGVAEAIVVATRFRLDLLTDADRLDDAARGVLVAKNAILPDLDMSGSMTMVTDPNQRSSLSFNTERTTWRAGVEMRMDDRKTERNAYRSSLVALRRAERDHEVFVDRVRADVRRAIRRIARENDLRMIQAMNVTENELRLQAAEAQFNLGRASNQDVVDAEDDILRARNDLANAVARYRNAILEFRLDSGTLRVTDDGQWDDAGP